MRYLVLDKRVYTCTFLLANVASKHLFISGMIAPVLYQGINTMELFSTHVTRKTLRTIMNVHMTKGVIYKLKLFVARFADKYFVTSVNMNMIFQLTWIYKCLITKSAGVYTITRVHF